VTGSGLKVSYRQNERWVSYATLLVSQRGFPWGRSNIDPQHSKFADPGRFSTLAILYSRLAASDDVERIMRQDGPIHGKLEAAPVLASDSSSEALPLIQIAGTSTSREGARQLVGRETDAFLAYLKQKQAANAISTQQRVLVTVVNAAGKPKVLTGRSKIPPLLTFVLVMALVTALAFVLDNLQPRIRKVSSGRIVEAADPAPPSALVAPHRRG
jgi:hypothetical protein